MSLYVFISYKITYPSAFDYKLQKDLIDLREWKDRAQCVRGLPESHFKLPLVAFLLLHAAAYFVARNKDTLNSNFKKMRLNEVTEKF